MFGDRSRRSKAVLFSMGVTATALVVVLVYALIAAAVNSTESNKRGESRESQVAANDQTLSIIKDCTQVGGECYERGQQNTAQILASAQRIIILSAACSVDLAPTDTVDQRIASITACVTKRLTTP